jgi:pimeloyl-ACP methyl ester carboxylesterase
MSATEQEPSYGSNAAAGHYVQTADAKIYYERYGQGGTPLVLLHGGWYGYIDEFSEVIRTASKTRTVIAIATRGYGRSERGTLPLSHRQYAADAFAVIQSTVAPDKKVDVLGFSEGAVTSYILVSAHPDRFGKLVAIGGPMGQYDHNIQYLEADRTTAESIQKQVPDLVAARKAIMPKPELWEPMIRESIQMYQAPFFVKQGEVRKIAIPTLIMVGDRDEGNSIQGFVDIVHLLPKGQLAVIPGCGHVVLACKPDLVILIVDTFLEAPHS